CRHGTSAAVARVRRSGPRCGPFVAAAAGAGLPRRPCARLPARLAAAVRARVASGGTVYWGGHERVAPHAAALGGGAAPAGAPSSAAASLAGPRHWTAHLPVCVLADICNAH